MGTSMAAIIGIQPWAGNRSRCFNDGLPTLDAGPAGIATMTKLTSLPERALELAVTVGDNLRQAVPAVTQHAGQWLDTGVRLGALKSGARVAGTFVRRNPVLIAAAVAGAGLLWYAAKRRARQAEEEGNLEAIEGSSHRIQARPAGRRTRTARTTRARAEH